MTEDHFRQIVNNRRPWAPKPLFAGEDELGLKIVGVATADAMRMRQARVAWRRIADDAWHDQTGIESVNDGVVAVATESASVRFELLRHKERIRKALAGSIPGFRDWVIVFAGSSPEQETDERHRDRRGKARG